MSEAEKMAGFPAVDITDALRFVANASEGVLVFDPLDRLTFMNERARSQFRGFHFAAGSVLPEIAEHLIGEAGDRALLVFKRACRKYSDSGFGFKLNIKDDIVRFRARLLVSGGVALSVCADSSEDQFTSIRKKQSIKLSQYLESLSADVTAKAVWIDAHGQMRSPSGQHIPSVVVPGEVSSEESALFGNLLSEVASFEIPHELCWLGEDGSRFLVCLYTHESGGFLLTHTCVAQVGNTSEGVEPNQTISPPSTAKNVLRGAVDQLELGISIVGSDRKLKYFNQRYLEIYDTPAESIELGLHVMEIAKLPNLSAIETLGQDISFEELLEQVANCNSGVHEILKIPSGRIIKVHFQSLETGGYVTTHQDITDQHENEERIRHMARHDALTNLPNRVCFAEQLEHAMAMARRGDLMALLCMDLDRFKLVNDTFGHAVGDQVLVEIGKRISSAIRDTEFAARIGGDEFTVLIGPLERPEHAAVVANRLIKFINRPVVIEGQSIAPGVSIGIAVAPDDGATDAELMRNADLALYRAKAAGRGKFHFFKSGMDREISQRRELEAALRIALENDEFELAFQPLLDIDTARVTGFESLLRWQHPSMGPLEPRKFINIVEESGLIVPLGRWILNTACNAATHWPDHVRVTVNLSAAQFAETELVNSVVQALEASGLRPDRLELEITESLLLRNPERNLKILHELRKTGVRISMDDFGTGYASLNHMREFPFDRVKIDGSIVSEIDMASDVNDIVAAMLSLGSSLGGKLNAEGVENEEQLDFVRKYGCTEVQGYLFSPPMPLHLATELLATTETLAAKEIGVDLATGTE